MVEFKLYTDKGKTLDCTYDTEKDKLVINVGEGKHVYILFVEYNFLYMESASEDEKKLLGEANHEVMKHAKVMF